MPSMAVPAALFAALLFIIVSSQPAYQLTGGMTERVMRKRLCDAAGNPTRMGLVVHALVFFGIFYAYARINNL